MSIIQYLKDTRGELHHVAWPTRLQTIVYTVIVVLLSIFIALYLGFFDFIFTTGLSRALHFIPSASAAPQLTVTQVPVGSTTSASPATSTKVK